MTGDLDIGANKILSTNLNFYEFNATNWILSRPAGGRMGLVSGTLYPDMIYFYYPAGAIIQTRYNTQHLYIQQGAVVVADVFNDLCAIPRLGAVTCPAWAGSGDMDVRVDNNGLVYAA